MAITKHRNLTDSEVLGVALLWKKIKHKMRPWRKSNAPGHDASGLCEVHLIGISIQKPLRADADVTHTHHTRVWLSLTHTDKQKISPILSAALNFPQLQVYLFVFLTRTWNHVSTRCGTRRWRRDWEDVWEQLTSVWLPGLQPPRCVWKQLPLWSLSRQMCRFPTETRKQTEKLKSVNTERPT